MEIPTQPKEDLRSPASDPTRHHYAYCRKHGYAPFVMYCKKCRQFFCEDCLSSDDPLFCKTCASSLIPVSQFPPLRLKSVAVFLALLFGFFGAHHFYTGHTGSGVAHMLITIAVSLVSAVFYFNSAFTTLAAIVLVVLAFVCIAQAIGYRKAVDAWGRPLI